MTRGLPFHDVPVACPLACPVAVSHDHRLPPWDKAFRRITPGALCRLAVCLCFQFGGWL